MSIFVLPALAYDYDELEPYIDARTLDIHHDKHHSACVHSLNDLLEGYPELRSTPIEHLLSNLPSLPKEVREGVRHYGGGHYAHSLLWEIMSPKGGDEAKGDISKAIDYYFRTFDDFKYQMSRAAVSCAGNGYAWLVLDGDELAIMNTANQDTPLLAGKTPLLVIDVWEHAYYLKYQDRRTDFVSNWWNTVNWDRVNELYLDATGKIKLYAG